MKWSFSELWNDFLKVMYNDFWISSSKLFSAALANKAFQNTRRFRDKIIRYIGPTNRATI